MSEPYIVSVKSSIGKDRLDTLHVVADGPEEAVAAVRAAVDPHAVVEVERKPVTDERALATGMISGRVLLG